jgi:hypothetical protein
VKLRAMALSLSGDTLTYAYASKKQGRTLAWSLPLAGVAAVRRGLASPPFKVGGVFASGPKAERGVCLDGADGRTLLNLEADDADTWARLIHVLVALARARAGLPSCDGDPAASGGGGGAHAVVVAREPLAKLVVELAVGGAEAEAAASAAAAEGGGDAGAEPLPLGGGAVSEWAASHAAA